MIKCFPKKAFFNAKVAFDAKIGMIVNKFGLNPHENPSYCI